MATQQKKKSSTKKQGNSKKSQASSTTKKRRSSFNGHIVEYPSSDYNLYSYTSSLQKKNPELYKTANSLIKNALGTFSNVRNKESVEINQLYSQFIKARDNERKFLHDFGFQETDIKSWRQFIEAFNILFSNKNIFEQKIKEIKRVSQELATSTADPSKFFDSYFTSALVDSFSKLNSVDEINEQWFLQNIKKALVRTYNAESRVIDDDLQQCQESFKAYEEFANLFEELPINNPVFKQLYSIYNTNSNYLVEAEESLKHALLSGADAKTAVNQIEFGNAPWSRPGFVLEAIESVTASKIGQLFKQSGFEVKTVATGATGQKGDTIVLIQAEATDNGEVLKILQDKYTGYSDSVRVQNKVRMNNLYAELQKETKTLENAYKSMVFISDKNYKIYKENKSGGFTAQSGVKLTNLGELFLANKLDQDKIKNLMFVLSNSGAGLINGKNYQNALDYIATQIAYFLFDDIDQEVEIPNMNAVHLFNLSGTYIPLSIFLESGYRALSNTKSSDYASHIKVSFEAADVRYKAQTDGLTLSDWEQFHNQILNDASVSVHFLRNFADFINEIFQQSL